ncbi:cytochrome c oxidase assembly protein [Paenibacillus sp. YYML68]|uniref:cytochrome c oxidase assembly protein n=1 Tax=Paenibacillus sp. YYML68 TaxID=2909250 RepID=UPI002491AD12|nr:cytochrome c oxidase assembly protein [Paenibacillus sp. YYML68]
MSATVVHTGHGAASSFAELWNPGLFLLLLLVGIIYHYAVNRWRPRFTDSEPVPVKLQIYFWLGLACWYIAEGSPLSYYGHHYYFSMHMLQQSILYLVMPPLLLMGVPGWLLRPALQGQFAKRIMKFITNPLLAMAMFNFIFSVYHIPFIMDSLMASPMLHELYKIIFLLAAFQLWFPVFAPLPEYNSISDLKKMAYIFVNGVLLTPACALIIFAKEPMYAMYAAVPAQLHLLPMLDDQQLGGVIMKIVQEIVYGYALAYIFFRWYRRERKEEEEELTADFYSEHGHMNRV